MIKSEGGHSTKYNNVVSQHDHYSFTNCHRGFIRLKGEETHSTFLRNKPWTCKNTRSPGLAAGLLCSHENYVKEKTRRRAGCQHVSFCCFAVETNACSQRRHSWEKEAVAEAAPGIHRWSVERRRAFRRGSSSWRRGPRERSALSLKHIYNTSRETPGCPLIIILTAQSE